MDKSALVSKLEKLNATYAQLVSNMTDKHFEAATRHNGSFAKVMRDPMKLAEDQDNEQAWDELKALPDSDYQALKNWESLA